MGNVEGFIPTYLRILGVVLDARLRANAPLRSPECCSTHPVKSTSARVQPRDGCLMTCVPRYCGVAHTTEGLPIYTTPLIPLDKFLQLASMDILYASGQHNLTPPITRRNSSGHEIVPITWLGMPTEHLLRSAIIYEPGCASMFWFV
jgi:hypothetical protein